MHLRSWVTVGLGLQICSSALADPTITSKITEVVVYGDRALISREAIVSVPAGDSRLELIDLPPDLDENSVGVAIRSSSGVTIRGMDVQRQFLTGNADARSAELLKHLEQLQAEKRMLQSQKSVLEEKREFFRRLSVGSSDHQPALSADELKKLYDLYSEELAGIATGLLDLDGSDRKLSPEIERVQRELNQLSQKKEQRRVYVSVLSQSPADLRVELRYMVPNASWTPIYEARVDTGNGKVSLQYDAMVRQRTGEDWTDAKLTVSTARPDKNGQMPELEPSYLRFLQLRPAAPSAMALEKALPAPSATPMSNRDELEEDNKARTESAKLESNGLSVTYQVAAPVTVPSDGQPHRTNLTQIELDGKLSYVTTPKLEAAAFLREHLTNSGPDPLLPGYVNLFRDGDLIGGLSLPLVAAGGEFDLFWGRDDAVKIEYKQVVNRNAEVGVLSHRQQNQRKYQITLQNFRKNAVKLTVYDQVPVSQDNEINVVSGQYSNKPTNIDKETGKITWDLDLNAGEKKTVEFEYTIEWPAGKAIEPM